MYVKKQQLKLDMEKWTGSKLGKKYIKAVHCYPAYLTYIQNASCEMPGWMNRKLESRLPGEISPTSDMQIITTLMAESEELKSLLMKVKEEGANAGLNLRSWHLVLSLHGKKKGKYWKQWRILFSQAPKSLWMVTEAVKFKDNCSLE